jgi:hypothetical protein
MAEDLIEVAVETPGGPQAMQVLRVETVPYWLGGVSVKHVRADLQDKLKAYKRWLVRTVYDAFLRELGTDVTAPASPEIADLIRQRDWHRAMAAMAEAQLALAQRVETVDARMDRAARVVGDVQRRLTRLEQQLNPGDVILDEQAAAIQNAVKALGVFLTSQDPSKNHFQAIWTEIGRRFRVPEYRRIRQHQYAAVLAFLEEWLQAALPAPNPRAPGQALPASPAPPDVASTGEGDNG